MLTLAKPTISKADTKTKVTYSWETEGQVECFVSKGDPLPTFTWLYQEWPCSGKANGRGKCLPQADHWLAVPSSMQQNPSRGQPTSVSKLTVPRNLPLYHAAFYKCQAANELGSDSIVIEFHRMGM